MDSFGWKIFGYIPFITIITKKIIQSNKQTNKKGKKFKNKPILELT